jgi:4-coumarate--CoA ligase
MIVNMTTIIEKTADGTIYRAAKTYPVPDIDLLTLLFGKSHLVM